MVVSDTIAYRDHAARTEGVAAVNCEDESALVQAVRNLLDSARPHPAVAAEVSPSHFAAEVLAGLVGEP